MFTLKKLTVIICCLFLLSAVIIIACRKEGSAIVSGASGFDAKAAKEFYYGVFKKSAEYKSYDHKTYGLKSPDWKHAFYQRKGNIEMVEFPLIKVKGRLLIPFKDSLSSADLGRIATTSLTRIVFIKNGAKIFVREMEYIPALSYASGKDFDISSNKITQLDKEFSGRIIQRYWNGKELSRKLIKDGVVKASGRIRQVTETASPSMARVSINSRTCNVYEICEWERDCEYTWIGDMLEKICGSWQQTGYCWIEEYCEGAEDLCTGLSDEQCNCAFYGDCNEDPVPEPKKTCEQLFSDIYSTGIAVNEKESVNDCGNTGTVRYKCYLWRIYTASGGLIPLVYKSSDKATQVRMPNKAWKFTKLEHIEIVKQGTEVGWTSSVSNVTATPSISSSYGVDNVATMHLLFTVKYEFKCSTGETLNFYDTKPAENSWHVNE